MREIGAADTGTVGQLHVVLLTRSVIAHYPAGGMELHTEVLRQGLARRGHTITTITTPHPESIPILADEWGETHYVGTGPAGVYSKQWERESVHALLDLQRDRAFDVVISQSGGGYGYLSARSRLAANDRLPVVLITHGHIANDLEVQLAQFTTRPLKVLRWLAGAIRVYARDARYLPQADTITVLSPVIGRRLRRLFWLGHALVEVVPNGIDVRRCLAAASQREQTRIGLGARCETCLIVGVGDFAPRKGFHHLLDALVTLKSRPAARDVQLALVGDGPMAGELRAQVARFGLDEDVVFTGRVPPEQIPALLCAADLVAMPSLQEGVPLTLLEAMACGRPVVATSVGGIPSILEDGHTGLLVPPGNPPALASALTTLISDRELARRLGASAQEAVIEQYDHDRMVDRYERVVRNAHARRDD